jgi:hypothetical protein
VVLDDLVNPHGAFLPDERLVNAKTQTGSTHVATDSFLAILVLAEFGSLAKWKINKNRIDCFINLGYLDSTLSAVALLSPHAIHIPCPETRYHDRASRKL